jgi:hypothetical protein
MLLIRAEWKSVKVSELAEDVILMLAGRQAFLKSEC